MSNKKLEITCKQGDTQNSKIKECALFFSPEKAIKICEIIEGIYNKPSYRGIYTNYIL